MNSVYIYASFKHIDTNRQHLLVEGAVFRHRWGATYGAHLAGYGSGCSPVLLGGTHDDQPSLHRVGHPRFDETLQQ